jgi:hypothetical protein
MEVKNVSRAGFKVAGSGEIASGKALFLKAWPAFLETVK